LTVERSFAKQFQKHAAYFKTTARIETDRRNQGFADFKIALTCAAASA
jgi:hypothetical protein